MSGKDSEPSTSGRTLRGAAGDQIKASGDDRTSERDFQLSESDAAAGAPADASVCGEEDPGVGLEFLVKEMKNPDEPHNHNGDKHDK